MRNYNGKSFLLLRFSLKKSEKTVFYDILRDNDIVK